jgi:hypothetical protein
VKWRPIIIVGLTCGVIAGLVIWLQYVRQVGSWLQFHTGVVNEPGHYYAFWSGFGSDIAEFSILGAIATALYQLVKKYNCHEPGCWRIGNHPTADGQFHLCYLHHPDFHGKKPTHELIERMHREHLEREVAIHGKLDEIRQRLNTTPAAANDVHAPDAPAHNAQAAGDRQTE